ncbi:CMP-N-acetylneuraminate-beta-galactosamide-alpha-2,3-sialyltransferase 1-like [Sebastes fasciatus]|uniref:CMP-N-acetylneuraminate-beta-galactosamide- alpha-2,3-sialyltransferase 1-like n=1 Tax=Sebastes fasciatus TaxID=394691 RepID=UPI003D9F07A5
MCSRKTRVVMSLLCLTAIGVFSRSSWILSVYRDSFPPRNSSLCACDKCLMEYDPWFSELMGASPEPFLSLRNNITEETFNWWKRIQYERRSFSFYNATVEKVFQMFPHSLNLIESNPDRCRTCAVVGNSGNLNGSRYGPLIDFHDVVIRINRGRIKGYEKDVGTRTTHRVMYPNSATNLDNTTYLLLFPFKINDLQWLLKSFAPREKKAADSGFIANKDLVVILSPAFMKYVHYVWLKRKGSYPSTGFMTLILSMHMCDEISVFGFGADRYGNWNHYYEILKNMRKNWKTGNHNGNHEYKIISKLYQQQKITFFKGW